MPRLFEWGNQGAGSRLRHHANTSTTYLPRTLMKSRTAACLWGQIGSETPPSAPPPQHTHLPRSLMKSPLVSGARLAQVDDTSLASLDDQGDLR